MAPKIELTYFNIEGAAEPVRLALALAGVEFEDKRLNFGEWAAFKETTPHGVVPVMKIDDGPYKGQSGAMLRWVPSLNPEKNLYPIDKIYDVEEAMGIVDDMKRAFMPSLYIAMRPQAFGYDEGFAKTDEGKAKIAEMRKKFSADELPRFLGYITEKIESSGGKWLVDGEYPTIADCVAVTALRSFTKGHIDHVDPKCLDSNATITDYVKRFCALPEIKGRYTDGLH